MRFKFYSLPVFLILFGCSSVDFIPEPDFRPNDHRYKVSSWQEVEIHRERPKKLFKIVGEIIIRNTEDLTWEDYEPRLKKEMFRRKIDGVWMTEKNQTTIDNVSVHTMDQKGRTTNSYLQQSNLPYWKGYAFRYK
ncbi:hypothetical protein EHQ92_17310 [Leptospira biflexa]|jgi:hypothetical protein|uniref:Lipoprotein n=1 Tax=Leptospira biflexa serovar Patoc (strain Patoc 1 / ATCC 23582 / Paris) TaxID=456481 RepID=B0SM51_LEPBP|nr:hypothetical protein [Leptospira biflexa]ABZ95006.1 Hypothetical protein LBF_2522 [Leptospira biflexa serovar Patoc strain 'Patoc 1 (Ames)']ABZ98681.1 Conserved hypothetical protein [Leptospira biflexa serovar Patoc strain 'Patoc 1 (Paris)']TGM32243.1 hypothetical protein EHQ89_15130 [Leptospira biflexa]TGM33809.1 hypothetical protein EHQ80_16335 [Leptospira biflexa]TGM42545.1 hypothetical protein EHQ92_17310 [Leptospira biflexa]